MKISHPSLSRPSRRQFVMQGLSATAAGLWSAGTSAYADQNASDPLTFFRIGTGPTAETLYSLGTAISAGISRPPGSSPCDEGGVCGVPGLIAVAQSREGSIQNIKDVRDGILESAIVHADTAYWAYNGGIPFKDRGVPDLRVIADLIPVSMHIIVRANSDIHSLPDLKHKTVSLGPKSTSTPRFVSTLLRANSVAVNKITPAYLNSGLAVDHLISGKIDAFFGMGAAPVSSIDELAGQTDIRILPINPLMVNTLRTLYPFLSPGIIPAGTYGNSADIPTVRLGVNWVVHAGIKESLIEDITRALWQSATANTFNLSNPGHRFPDVREGRPSGFIPIHPGAKTYYDSLEKA